MASFVFPPTDNINAAHLFNRIRGYGYFPFDNSNQCHTEILPSPAA